MELSEYTFEFKHIPGKLNSLADYMSRMQDPDHNQPVLAENSEDNSVILPFVETNLERPQVNALVSSGDPAHEISESTFLAEQSSDPFTSEIITILKNPSLLNAAKVHNFFINESSKLLMFISNKQNNAELIVVPQALKSKVLEISHISHLGVQKTYEILSKRYFWKGMYNDTKNFVLSCHLCNKYKSFTPKQAPYKAIRIPKYPNDFISMDIVGPIRNCGHVLTVLDHFSKHLALYPLKNLTAETITGHLLQYISVHGRPEMILTDLGTQFTSLVFESITKSLGIKLSHCTPQRPECNAQSERVNTSIKTSLLTLHEKGVSFQNALLIHQNIYNGTIHPSTGYSPNILHFGRNLSLLFDTFHPDPRPAQLDKSHYLCDLLTRS
ncbi:uncharacterized protein K02A2.6-like [Stegodyphus dumicola]|uniref:uncharacterized protein K02A2.6-like n=1 Tax=Stegodyphus dumicola TaxID=202533 RepID=UPI0015AF04A1|nr:uncharacterized protein K02A2.6-like [Stegodyphus dumicola]